MMSMEQKQGIQSDNFPKHVLEYSPTSEIFQGSSEYGHLKALKSWFKA